MEQQQQSGVWKGASGRSSGAALQVLRSLWQLVLTTSLTLLAEPVCLQCRDDLSRPDRVAHTSR